MDKHKVLKIEKIWRKEDDIRLFRSYFHLYTNTHPLTCTTNSIHAPKDILDFEKGFKAQKK